MTGGTCPPIYYDPFDAEIDRGAHAVWKRMHEEQPVYWNERYGFWALSRFEDVWTGYHDTETFSSTHGVQPEALDKPAGLPLVIFMDPPEHDWMRKLVSPAFTPRRIAALESRVGDLVGRYLDPVVARRDSITSSSSARCSPAPSPGDIDPSELVPVQTSPVSGFSSVPIHL
jgi:cytochrome P450